MRTITFLFSLVVLGCVTAAAAEAPGALASDPSGWADIMPDRTLAGWTRIPVPPTDGLKPQMQWTADRDAGVLICRGDGQHEWLRFDEKLSDFILHVEWNATEREGRYNSGIGVRMSPYAEIWHQAQTTPAGGYMFGDTLVDGNLQRVSLRQQMTENRLRPAGEWNTFEIRCEGGTITLWVNGAVVNRWENMQVRSGHIALEAEGYPISFRNLKLKKLP